MNLSKRLKRIADFVEHGATVIDVGCDHALLSCYLVIKDKALKVYASDNKEGPLSKAKENIEKLGLEEKVITILADGLSKCPKDADTLIIAGMGVNTCLKILEAYDIRQFKRIIIQVNAKVNELRQYISDNNYTIVDEDIIEDDFFYEIVVFNTIYHEAYSDLEIKYGPIILKEKNQAFNNYLDFKKKKLLEILSQHSDFEKEKELKEIERIKKDAFASISSLR